MPAKVVEIGISLNTIDCCDCGITFAVPQDWHTRKRRDHSTFWCPNGHGNCYPTETDEQKRIRFLEEKLARAHQDATDAARNEMVEREARKVVEGRLRATKGELTKMRKRVTNGACPCCNRTFQDLARHMKSKHPEHIFHPARQS